ncbi:MAG: phosphoribosylformylglycinamidine cyclo-ligase [Coriobacteriales bacterium]|nr:phosphoribosylformylglycinamidine cyclo-ligase [Coriobacteriales bacterium]
MPNDDPNTSTGQATQSQSISYKDSGVDIDAGAAAVAAIKAAVYRTYTSDVIGDLGGFGGLFSAASLQHMQDPVLVSGTDGVGTKLELARRVGRLDTVGIDLVAMCVNDIICSGARPLFFLDYVALGILEPARVATVVGGIAKGCEQAGCALIGGEMAEHPGVMAADALDLSGFCVGVVDRPKMLGSHLVQEDDVIIGLASTGLHSNGYSLVRKALTDELDDAELLTKKMANDKPLLDALLEPTAIYAKPLEAALAAGLPIHAAAHITGGGITHNLDRVLPAGLDAQIRLGSWVIPPVIQQVAFATNLAIDELLTTFNMGIGMALIVPAEALADVIKHFRLPGAQTRDRHGGVFEIGRIVKAADKQADGTVVYLDRHQTG